jgi:hypothetical protein
MITKKGKYYFANELEDGIIKCRPNRFVMIVNVNGFETKCFCPCPTRIGELSFSNVPCLLSRNESNNTKYTVEAISLNHLDCKRKSWIGVAGRSQLDNLSGSSGAGLRNLPYAAGAEEGITGTVRFVSEKWHRLNIGPLIAGI